MVETTREVAIEHLSLLHVSPPDLVDLARQARFDSIGVRVFHPDPALNPWPMLGASPMLAQTINRAADQGIRILDIEALAVRPGLHSDDYEPMLEAGARLGARYLNVMGADPDLLRATDTFAALTAVALSYGIRPALEPIFHHAGVRNLDEALAIVSASNGGCLQIDALHFFRFDGTVEQLKHIEPSLLGYLQLDDAPVVPPDSLDGRRTESRTGRLLPGDGELELGSLVSAMPDGTIVALETPNVSSREDPLGYAIRGRRAVDRCLSLQQPAERT